VISITTRIADGRRLLTLAARPGAGLIEAAEHGVWQHLAGDVNGPGRIATGAGGLALSTQPSGAFIGMTESEPSLLGAFAPSILCS
jgi:hypothetical protein